MQALSEKKTTAVQDERTADQPLKSDIRSAFFLAWPNVLGSIVQTLVGWFILKQVGLLGSVEIAAYGLGRTIVLWAGSAYWALNAGVMALVARHIGRQQMRRAGTVLINDLYIALTLTIATASLGGLLAPQLLSWFGGSPQVVQSGAAFLHIYMVAMIFMVCWYQYSSTLRAAGETRTAMYLQ